MFEELIHESKMKLKLEMEIRFQEIDAQISQNKEKQATDLD